MITVEQVGEDMEPNEKEEKRCGPTLNIHIEDAIKIAKILSQAPEERLPMIINVLEKARVYIDGLGDLEEWKALRDQAYIVDMDEFVTALTDGREPKGDGVALEVALTPKEFNEVCKRFNVKPSCAKRALHRKGRIKTTESNGKLEYTVPVWVSGKAERRVIIKTEVFPKAVEE